VNAYGFADGIASGPAAAFLGAPVLLVGEDLLPGSVANEIKRLDPVSIVVVGGTGVISNAVANQLGALIN